MPTSRSRKKKRHSNPQHAGHSRPQRPAGVVPQVTAANLADMRAAADAELAGDPVEALRCYERITPFKGSLHHDRLRQLADLGDDAPSWLWSRWMTVQAQRPLWDRAAATAPDRAVVRTLETMYPDEVEPPGCMPPELFVLSMLNRDWVTRQLGVYEHGGLAEVVRRAGPRLIAGADQPQAWAEAPLRVLRFESEGDEHVRFVDLATQHEVDVLDLGVGVEHEPGQHLLGRLVPVSGEPGLMLEWSALPVSKATATKVAQAPDRWVDILSERAHAGVLPPRFSYRDMDTSLACDFPVRAWLGLLDPEDLRGLPEQGFDIDGLGPVVLRRVLAVILEMRDPSPLRHLMEQLLLEPGMVDRLRAELGGPEHSLAWLALAEVVREPSRSRCLDLARWRFRSSA